MFFAAPNIHATDRYRNDVTLLGENLILLVYTHTNHDVVVLLTGPPHESSICPTHFTLTVKYSNYQPQTGSICQQEGPERYCICSIEFKRGAKYEPRDETLLVEIKKPIQDNGEYCKNV